MTTYIVTNKASEQEVYRYSAMTPIEWQGFEFATHDHAAEVIAPDAVTDATLTSFRVSKLQYMNRFTDAELAAIYSTAKVSVAVEIWLAKFNAATPDSNGTAIDLADPQTISGLQALEAVGLIGPGRAAEIGGV